MEDTPHHPSGLKQQVAMCPDVLYTHIGIGKRGPQRTTTHRATNNQLYWCSGSVSLFALASDLGWREDGGGGLVQSGGDLVDVVQTNHGEDEATGRRQKGPGVSGPAAGLVPPRTDTSIRKMAQAQG